MSGIQKTNTEFGNYKVNVKLVTPLNKPVIPEIQVKNPIINTKESVKVASKDGSAKTFNFIGDDKNKELSNSINTITGLAVTGLTLGVGSTVAVDFTSNIITTGLKGSTRGLGKTALKATAGVAVGAAVGSTVAYGVSKLTDNKDIQKLSAVIAGALTGAAVSVLSRDLDISFAVGSVWGATCGGFGVSMLTD